jgi:hypothetical protein
MNPYFNSQWPNLIPPGVSNVTRKRMIFMLAATWPDAIKRDSNYHNDGDQGGDRPTGPEAGRNTGYDDFNRHKYWHFVDQPFSQDGSDANSFQVPVPDAQTQIAVFRQVLQSTDAGDGLKSYDLVWLLHLVGDVHQPLHCATRISANHPQGDAGGNGVVLCAVKASACTGKLHAFWDDILGTNNTVAAADKFAGRLKAPSVAAGDLANANAWIADSFSLAQSNAYIDPVGAGDGPFQATNAYTKNARSLARRQTALAGARLAGLLKADLK